MKHTQSRIGLACLMLGLCFSGVAHADLRVSMADALKAATSHPAPEYSPVAKQMHVAGRVEVEATVGEDGTVENAKALTGNPLLTASAVTAVKKWKFTPFTSGGAPTKAVVTLNFDFKP